MSRAFCFHVKNCTKHLTKYLWLLYKRLLKYQEENIDSFKKEQVNKIYK